MFPLIFVKKLNMFPKLNVLLKQ